MRAGLSRPMRWMRNKTCVFDFSSFECRTLMVETCVCAVLVRSECFLPAAATKRSSVKSLNEDEQQMIINHSLNL